MGAHVSFAESPLRYICLRVINLQGQAAARVADTGCQCARLHGNTMMCHSAGSLIAETGDSTGLTLGEEQSMLRLCRALRQSA